MAYTTEYSNEDKNIITDTTFGMEALPQGWFNESPKNDKLYARLFALAQFAWVTNNAWVYNFCKDVGMNLRRNWKISDKQLLCLEKNEAKALEGYTKRT